MSFTKFKSCLKKHSFEQIMQGTREYLKTITDKQYQKYPKTFLTNESYMNDYSEEIKRNWHRSIGTHEVRRKLLGLGGYYETTIQ